MKEEIKQIIEIAKTLEHFELEVLKDAIWEMIWKKKRELDLEIKELLK